VKISNSRVYDFLKAVAMVWLPALGTAYFALAGIWNLPVAEEVVGSIVVIDTFLGAVVQISTSNYNSERVGDIEITELPSGGKTFTLNLAGDPEDIELHEEVRFGVTKGTTLAKPSDLEALDSMPQGRRRRQPHA
jgi:Putative phage holin Dp-1